MRRSMLVVLVLLFIPFLCFAQTPADVLKQVRQIKPLETTRLEVAQILYRYRRADSDDHRDSFEADDIEIEVFYSSGVCSDDEETEDPTEMWTAEPSRVTRIEVEFDEGGAPKAAGLDISKFRKEQMYHQNKDSWMYHDRASGWAFTTNHNGLRSVLVFPPASKTKLMCRDLTYAHAFYTRKSWFAEPLEERTGEISCQLGTNVNSLDLSATEISGATSNRQISVRTSATDPENDVLVYAYRVSAGQIKGTGPDVIWDLTGVGPGTYIITAAVDDGCGFCGKTMTMMVVVK